MNKRFKLIALDLIIIALSVTVLSVSTFAWLLANRQSFVALNNITVDSGLDVKIKYYKGNFVDKTITSKYSGYQYDSTRTIDYATDFVESTNDITNKLLNISNFSPSYDYTFAIEVNSRFADERQVNLSLDNFTSNPSYVLGTNTLTDIDYTTKQGIVLASGIHFYSQAFAYSAPSLNTDITTFINSRTNINKFNYDENFTSSYDLSNCLINPYVDTSSTMVFIFTIGFSDDPSTYYTEYKYDEVNDQVYYVKNTNGSSLPYRNLSFSIDKLRISPRDRNELKLNLNGGVSNNVTSLNYLYLNEGETLSYLGSIVAPTKRGYLFSGWYDSLIDGTKYTSTSLMPAYLPSLYAHWTPLNIDVTFNSTANGGNNIITSSKTVTYNSSLGEVEIPTKKGYDFLGWFNAQTGGEQYAEINIIDFITPITLYAQFSAKQITITFDSNGGSASNSILATYNQSIGTLPTPVFNTFVFAGWYTAVNGGTRINDNYISTFVNDITLFAHWING